MYVYMYLYISGGSNCKQSTCNAGDPGQSLGREDPLAKGMVGYPLQYSFLEYSMDRFCLLNSR